MNKFHAAVRAACLAAAVLLPALPALALDAGQRAPDFELAGPQGTVRLADYKGKTVYLDFWASWCVPCRQSFPWMNEMQARYKDSGLRVLGINVDQKPADAKTFLERLPAGFDLAFDAAGKTPRSYEVKAMPTSVLIGPTGTVLAVHRGFASEDRAGLERAIRQALNLKGDKP